MGMEIMMVWLGVSGVVGFPYGLTGENVPKTGWRKGQTLFRWTVQPTGALFFRRLHDDLKKEAQGNPLKSGRR